MWGANRVRVAWFPHKIHNVFENNLAFLKNRGVQLHPLHPSKEATVTSTVFSPFFKQTFKTDFKLDRRLLVSRHIICDNFAIFDMLRDRDRTYAQTDGKTLSRT